MVKMNKRAVMFFFVNRPEGEVFEPADLIDPAYGRELRKAGREGVELLAYRVAASTEGYTLRGRVPIDLE